MLQFFSRSISRKLMLVVLWYGLPLAMRGRADP